MAEAISKVKASHLKRDAYLYIRQSTVRQVFENTESTKRQYALRQRAVALGWPQGRVRVIDCDLGRSGASAADREGFRKLVAEVGMGHAGIVLGLEVSRLARNCTDWHRLLEICALSDTLILDEDGLYDPNEFNDRLLLGLKGTMSEAELHLLRARLRGGIMNKARRGELVMRLPIGLVTDDRGRVRLDPDKQVRESVALFFETFRRRGSALATVRRFREEGLLFPRRLRAGPRKGKLTWGPLGHTGSLHMLHNPRYAGAFAFGRNRVRRRADGGTSIRKVPRDEWHVLIPGAHEGYISWEEYEDNQRRLRESAQAHGQDRKKSPPREGSALLQGIVLCGVCGRRMTVRYCSNRGGTHPEYACQIEGTRWGMPFCQRLRGDGIDAAVGELLLETLTPVALDVALAVQRELSAKLEEADRIRARQVERARYEADIAQQRFMKVDPGNRLVADVLEAEWNESLRAVQRAREEYERQRREDRVLVDEEARSRVMALAADFPRLWKDPKTSHRDRKRMVRLLIEDVTLIRKDRITVQVRFKGGVTRTLTLPLPKTAAELRRTPPETVAEIDRLLDHHTYRRIAAILNERGFRSGEGRSFTPLIVMNVCRGYNLKARYDRLREKGMLTVKEMAAALGITAQTVMVWCREGLLRGHAYNDKNECLFDPPGPDAPVKSQGWKLAERRRFPEVTSDRCKEVQCEA